jgi:hypothetical protein
MNSLITKVLPVTIDRVETMFDWAQHNMDKLIGSLMMIPSEDSVMAYGPRSRAAKLRVRPDWACGPSVRYESR